MSTIGQRGQDTKAGSPKVGLNWHTDHYHLPEPGLFTYLHAIQVPPGQGDTRYANGIAAYEALPADKRAEIDGLKVLHSRARLFKNLFPEATEVEMEAERQKVPDVVHPLVRMHPELGGAASISAANGARASTAWSRTGRRRCTTSCCST